MIRLRKTDLNDMYSKAKLAYRKCIEDEENEFLKNEIKTPIHSIKLKEESVMIKYLENNVDNYILEIKIQLLSTTDDILGSYIYYENENGIGIDDILKFE